ncbi:hypothetical protein PG984_002417 [Apiospora sp. TS-2023a]
MKTHTFLSVVGLAVVASAGSVAPRAGDPLMGPATCGIGGKARYLDHTDLAATVEKFASWVGSGADGQVDTAGNFHYKLHMDDDDVTLFACDSKSGNKGSIITPNLIRQALSESGYLDNQCGKDNSGYESSNDLTIGRTFKGDHYC